MKTKNRLLASVLCLLMVVFCIVGLTACGGDDKCSHQWGKWSTTTNATCTKAGSQERKCSKCGETERSTIAALGHDWNEATCSTPKTCKVCSATKGTASAHAYTVETVKDEALKSAATCTSAAVYYKSCSCGAISTNDADTFTNGSVLDHIDANKDHACDYNCGENLGTCADANKDHACDYGCEKSFGEHSDSNTDNDHVCDYGCGAVIESCSDAEDDGDHNCDVCNNADITDHSFSNATCGAPATCSECGATTGSTLEHKDENHDHICDNGCGKNDMGAHEDSATDNDHVCDYGNGYENGCKAVFNNCSDVDTDDDHNCDVCGKANVTSHAHVENTALATEATCSVAATKTYECNCGDTYTENDGDALGHNITGVQAVERHVNGCEYVLVYVCQRENCGEEVLGETIHKHSYVASIKTPATCTTPGEKTFECSACGDTSKATEPIPADATGHNWTTGNVVEGVRTDTCSVCSETKTVTVYTGNKTDEVKAEDLADKEIELNDANISLDSGVIDTIGDQNVTVSADKLEGDDRENLGLSNEQLAQVGNSPIYNFTINNGTENISNFGEDNYVTITLPYTLAPGEDVDSIAVWFINDEGELESIKATYNNGYVTFKTNHFSYYTVTRLTPAERCALHGHGYVEQVVEGSCTKDGYVLLVCVRCHDKQIKEGTFVEADGHDYASEIHNATCTESGYTLYTCNDCDHSYRTKINATGHAWSVEDSAEASCVADGYTKYGCDNCAEEYTITYAKLAHVYTNTVVPATCTADGYTLHDCDNCDYSYTDANVAALGHEYESTTWAWASDYSTATLTFVCEHNEEHVMVLNATITKSVVNGTCSNFVKTTYTATLSYDGTDYTDQKVVELGTPDHNFSTDWSKDEDEHWHECVCGEKIDVAEHTFGNATTTKNPTCVEAGESTSYCVCGETKITTIPATGDHDYVDGVCSVCGVEFVDVYYVNLINSWKNIDGFAIKIQDFSCEIKEHDSSLIEELRLLGSIKQLDIAELALYVENGEIGGAATGSIVVFNGPISNANAVYKFRAVIYEEYVYISVEYGKDTADKTMNIKLSVDALIESLLEEMDIEGETIYVLEFFKDTLIPTLDTLVELNVDETNAILEDAFNMIFTFEQQADGSYIATLDYDKLYVLNENLATKPVAGVIDIYFGEGAFDAIVELALEILNLEISEIPAYLDEHGLNSEELFAKINELAAMAGAPEGYDIADILKDEEFAGVTLGMLIFGVEDNSYVEVFNNFIDALRKSSLYELIDADSIEEIKDGVKTILDMISENISVSFTTDSTGMLTSTNFEADNFVYSDGVNEISLNFNLEIVINGRIEVTWGDIIEEIENNIVLPDEEMLEEDIYSYYDNVYYGYVVIDGKEYYYSNGICVNAYTTIYDELSYIMISPDCNNWTAYEACYADKAYRFTIAPIEIDGEVVVVLINHYSGEVVKLIQTETGFTAVFENGTEKAIVYDFSVIPGDIAQLYTEIFFAIFENPEGRMEHFGDYVDYYFNHNLGEYSNETHHEYEYEVHGEICNDGGCTIRTTCKHCDYYDEYTRYWCDIEYGVDIDLSEYSSCGGTMNVDRCSICGYIAEINDMNIGCDINGETTPDEFVDENGITHYITTMICPDCGLKFVADMWTIQESACVTHQYQAMYIYVGEECIFEYTYTYSHENHNHEYSYELEGDTCADGYKVTYYCTICGESDYWWSSGHRSEEFDMNLTDHNGCEGTISGRRCSICGYITDINVMNIGCDINGETTPDEFVDENGITHYITTMICPDCGLKFVADMWTIQESACVTHQYQAMYIYVGEECIFEYTYTYFHENHNYEYSYELEGETCEDGYTTITTCENCDYHRESTSNYHNTYTIFALDDEHECCDGHNFEVRSCPCGQEFYIDFERYSFRFDEELQMYVCDNCDIAILYNITEVEEGCSLIVTANFAVYYDGEELYSVEKEETCANHNFTDVQVSVVDGVTYITISCEKCDTVNSIEILSVELEQHNGEYYYDYTFTPDESAMYSIVGLADRDTYVTLYKMVGGQLVEISHDDDGSNNNQFLLNYNLTAGTTYVYRIRFYNSSNSGSISFAFTKAATSETVCQHGSYTMFSVLLDGSETCEDGALYGIICTECGCIEYDRVVIAYNHRTIIKDRVDLAENGACYGEFVYYSCACGQAHGMNLNACYDNTWTDNEYYDEEGRLIHVDVRTCSECGLRYTRSYYTVKDRANCTLTYYYTVVINVGGNLIAERDYTVVEVNHDYEVIGTLMNGAGSSCEDGVVITYKCKDCEHEVSHETYDHETYEKEHINLSDLGSVCGGYATVYGCACGERGSLSLAHSLCELGSEWCELWIENAITDGQYTINGWNSFSYGSYLYICAVTDPEDAACAYKIRYAHYWLKDENSCMAYHYETWQFGYNEETGTYEYAVTFKTGSSRVYHNYVDGSTDNHVKYDCPDCGSYYYQNLYYDDNNNCTKDEKLVSNTLDNGFDKYYEYVKEYAFDANGNRYVSREYSKRIYSDGSEYWSEQLREEEVYVGAFGDPGRKVSYSCTNSYGESYSEEYANVWYNGYEFRIYTYRIEGDFWYRYDYTYSFDDGCVQKEVYTNSDGAREEKTNDICRFWNYVTIQNSTCSQDGEECRECVVCGKRNESYTAPHDHNWVQVTDNWHYCFTCGLENANGVSGDIIMEDLTDTYGNGEYYVVGYYARNNVEFSKYVSLVLADGTTIDVLTGIEFTTIDGIRAYAFSKAAVEAWATENGYTDYDVRFSFVPVGSDGSFDYGVTFTEPTVVTDTISDNVSFTDYIGAGETKSYTITPTEDGVWTFISFADGDTKATLYDANGNELAYNDDGANFNGNFKITYELKAGETYIINVCWYNSDNAGDVPLLFGTAPVIA